MRITICQTEPLIPDQARGNSPALHRERLMEACNVAMTEKKDSDCRRCGRVGYARRHRQIARSSLCILTPASCLQR